MHGQAMAMGHCHQAAGSRLACTLKAAAVRFGAVVLSTGKLCEGPCVLSHEQRPRQVCLPCHTHSVDMICCRNSSGSVDSTRLPKTRTATLGGPVRR